MKTIKHCFFSTGLVALAIAFMGWDVDGHQAHASAERLQDANNIVTQDLYVQHVSTVPANINQTVQLFVREVVRTGGSDNKPAVLMIGGSTQPAVATFDLPFRNYSWMRFLAASGLDAFTMDLTGYGLSPRPEMDNPCNAQEQALLIPNPLSATCQPSDPHLLTTSQTDWDEIDRVVDYIRDLKKVDRVNLIGWSLGGPRTGGYAATHKEKVDKLFLYAPAFNLAEATSPPTSLPNGFPMTVRSVLSFFKNWDAQVSCEDQFDPAIRPTLLQTIEEYDPLGSTWGSPPPIGTLGTLWRSPQQIRWGWNDDAVSPESAPHVNAPTLIIGGDLDKTVVPAKPRTLFADLTGVPKDPTGAPHKVYVHVACAAHQMVWEKQHMVLLTASREWLRSGTFDGYSTGSFAVDAAGNITIESLLP
jgi:pimeloyl-ACP methyl ester carboxylesterase